MLGGVTGDGTGQTIAIIDAYDDPNIIGDVAAFSTQFSLPQFNVAGGPTFTKLNENGGSSCRRPSGSTRLVGGGVSRRGMGACHCPEGQHRPVRG